MTKKVYFFRSRKFRIALAVMVSAIFLVAGVIYAIPFMILGERVAEPAVAELPVAAPIQSADSGNPADSIKVLTVNLAHGRATSSHQIFLSKKEIRGNLADVKKMLEREAPDVVALQEADGPSFWSGDFNHVNVLAESSGFPFAVRAGNVQGLGLSYGTALLAARPITGALALTFKPTPPTFSKGFIIGTVAWPGEPAFKIDVVSVHFDYASAGERRSQARQMIERLRDRGRPLIVMGDFNTTWDKENDALRIVVEALGLEAWRPDDDSLVTFPQFSERLDWILVSEELVFESSDVLDDVVSDHRAVSAVIGRGGH